MSFKIPSLFIKKIFPPKKSVFTIDTTGNGKADSLQIKAFNVIQPFTIPENIDLGDFDIEDFDLSEHAQISIDGEPINISKDTVNLNVIRDTFLIYYKGVKYTLDDILGGKLGGKLIAMGDAFSILIKLDEDDLNKLTEGKHSFKIDAESIPNLDIEFELDKNSIHQKFDPSKT